MQDFSEPFYKESFHVLGILETVLEELSLSVMTCVAIVDKSGNSRLER